MSHTSEFDHYVSSFSPLVLRWLAECDSIHPKCSSQRASPGSPSFLPTRLIDLGPPDSQTQPKLVLTSQSNIGGSSYIALSHRWPAPIGDPSQVSTARWGTLQHRLSGIDLTNGEINFRFAVHFCRWLKVRYLWIDCYCINQGDTHDWETESNRMDMVYAHAYCTLAINRTIADDPQTDHDYSYDPTVDPQKDAPAMGWLHDIAYSSERAEETQFLLRAIKYGPLGERAWCFQERMLSPRVLYFLDGGVMLWECCTFIGITGWPSNLPRIPIINQYLDYKGSSAAGYKRLIDYDEEDADESNPVDCPCANQHETVEDESDSYDSDDAENVQMKPPAPFSNVSSTYHCVRYSRANSVILNAWYAAVSEYSRRTLTVETDRPYALRGYINKVVELTGSDCHYGILACDVARGLLWLPDTQFEDGELLRQALPEIPSWSWLHARQPVKLACSPTAAAWYIRSQILRSGGDGSHQREMEIPEIGSPQIFDLVFSEQGKVITFTGLFAKYPAMFLGDATENRLGIWDRQDLRAAIRAGVYPHDPIALGFLDFPNSESVYTEVTILFVSSRFGLLVEFDETGRRYRRLGLVSYADGDSGPLSRLRTRLSNDRLLRSYLPGIRISLG